MKSPYLRGFSKENLFRGLIAAVVVATVIVVLLLPFVALLRVNFGPSKSFSPFLLWLFLALIWFVLITLFHAMLHAFFALLHQRGEAAFECGDHRGAIRLLYLFSIGVNHHYDESGEAHRALLAAYLHLKRDEDAARITERCENLGFETDLEAKD